MATRINNLEDIEVDENEEDVEVWLDDLMIYSKYKIDNKYSLEDLDRLGFEIFKSEGRIFFEKYVNKLEVLYINFETKQVAYQDFDKTDFDKEQISVKYHLDNLGVRYAQV